MAAYAKAHPGSTDEKPTCRYSSGVGERIGDLALFEITTDEESVYADECGLAPRPNGHIGLLPPLAYTDLRLRVAPNDSAISDEEVSLAPQAAPYRRGNRDLAAAVSLKTPVGRVSFE